MADTGTHMSAAKKKNSVKLKYTTFIPGDNSKQKKDGEEEISLQEAFKKYRKAKKKQLKHARRLRRRNELRKADPKVMAALRRKFIQQAKKYFGYPYAKKYWPPDSPEYRSNLFLDCCGLVRQVMRDLADDFGFVIGPWNQAYMFDTLPISIKEEEMRPGDLVFVSATYCNPKSKKQPHNMTHVEIWLGDGPKTIGARWNNGKVQVFDSYRFTAKSYYDETYHFKSIDTWLKGICRSHCSQHGWKRRKFNPRKKSVFSIDDQQSSSQNDQQDENAAEDPDDITNFIMHGNNFTDSEKVSKKTKNNSKNKSKSDKQKQKQKGKESSASTIASTVESSKMENLSKSDKLDKPEKQQEETVDDTEQQMYDVDNVCDDVDAANGDADEEEDGLSEDDNSDLESGSDDLDLDDLDDGNMEFIDAGDDEDDVNDGNVDPVTGVYNGPQTGVNDDPPTTTPGSDPNGSTDTDVRESLSRSGRLVDLDNRGIYLGGLYNGDANSPVLLTDIDKQPTGSSPDPTAASSECHICLEKASELKHVEQNTDKVISKSDEPINDIANNIGQLTIVDKKGNTTTKPQLANKDEKIENVLCYTKVSQYPVSSDTNQNALPNGKGENKSCTSPATSSRLSPDSSTSGSSCESSTMEKKLVSQSTGSDECMAGSRSSNSIQTDYKGAC